MSPRGVAIPGARERLFVAAERVLVREGPGALTSRAVTTEAGCAKGLLHNHFGGLDEFIAALVLDRFARAARRAAELEGEAGRGTVAGNLLTVALALLDDAGPTASGLAMSRPGATARVREQLAGGAPGFTAIEEAFAAYLAAERELGRVARDLDTGAAALAVVSAVHHLLMTGWADAPDPRERVRRVVALVAG